MKKLIVLASLGWFVALTTSAWGHPAVWRRSTGEWYFLNGDWYQYWDTWGVPVTLNNYDWDGRPDVGIWQPSDGVWRIINSSDRTERWHQWGASGDVPVPGDYDGDGGTDLAVWRPSEGVWYVLSAASGYTRGFGRQWGTVGDIPVPGDYDGDGKTDYAVWRPSTSDWFIINSANGTVTIRQWGSQPHGDVPVPGDYDGDGKTDLAVWRASTGEWFIIKSSTDTVMTVRQLGTPADMPVPGDYDGDGKTDLAVWQVATGVWRSMDASTGVERAPIQWGSQPHGDVPVPSGPASRIAVVPAQAVLTVGTVGTSGTVTSAPLGINCGTGGTDCSEQYPTVTLVTLTATPAAGSIFSGWSGRCTGTGPCTVAMHTNISATAHFALPVLTVVKAFTDHTGSGTVTSTPAGINCEAAQIDCWAAYASGTQVTLTAAPTLRGGFTDSWFAGWGGVCYPGTGTCTVTLTANTLVPATFVKPTVRVSPASVPPGGTVTVTWSGILTAKPRDWIGLFRQGAPNELPYLEPIGVPDPLQKAWVYANPNPNNCTRTAGPYGVNQGSCSSFPIPAGLPAGTYELRLFPDDTFDPPAVTTLTVQ